MKPSLLSIFIIAFLSLALQAQILNSGFENWMLGDPDFWYTNNVISLKPITQSSDAHSGSSSVRLRVLNNIIPYGSTLYSGEDGTGFPVSQRNTNLSGYFKYSPKPNTIFQVLIGMYQAGNIIGAGSVYITTSATNWMQFNVPIGYTAPGNPDTCLIFITLTSGTDTGAVGYIDDLALGGSSGVEELNIGQFVSQFELKQNYPNPFNPTTNIEFSVPQASDVKLKVYNQLGQTVATLVDDRLSAGSYSVDWNATDLPSGVFYYRMTASDFSKTIKLMLMK